MKKLLIITIQVFIATVSFGQFDFDDYIQVGVSGGYSLSTVDFQPGIQQSNLGGIHGGLILNYFAEKNVGIQLEVNYAQRGWQDYHDDIGTYKRQMNYFEIPLLAHFSWHISNFRVQLDVGPYVGFQSSYTEEYDESLGLPGSVPADTIILGDRTYYGKPADNEFDYGFMAGLGPAYSTKVGEFQLRLRYVQSLQSIFDQYPEGNFRFSQMRSMYAGFAWVYPIYLGRKE